MAGWDVWRREAICVSVGEDEKALSFLPEVIVDVVYVVYVLNVKTTRDVWV